MFCIIFIPKQNLIQFTFFMSMTTHILTVCDCTWWYLHHHVGK